MATSFAHYVRSTFFDLQYMLQPTFSVEVGAYDANFSRQMRESNPKIKAYAFEASPENYKKFSHDLINAWGVNYLFGAICDHVGSTYFNIQRSPEGVLYDGAPNNSIMNRIGSDQVAIEVPADTLDSFFIDSGLMSADDSACLWLDVEGAAGLILPSAEKFLAQTPSILIEVEHHKFWDGQWLSGDVHNFLADRGYALLARDYEYYPTQENYLYVKGVF